MKTYKCKFCDSECQYGSSKVNKFCSNTCQGRYQWEYITKPRIEAGLCQFYARDILKRYLAEKYGNICAICGQPNIWNNHPLVFHLDHIDGNSDNNLPTNLRLACPNCHSQTETYCNKLKCKKKTKRNTYLRKMKGY
jgi:hypothetical protein